MDSKTPSCCRTAKVIDMLSCCLCIRTPRYETLSAQKRQEIEEKAELDLLAQKMFYSEKGLAPTKSVM